MHTDENEALDSAQALPFTGAGSRRTRFHSTFGPKSVCIRVHPWPAIKLHRTLLATDAHGCTQMKTRHWILLKRSHLRVRGPGGLVSIPLSAQNPCAFVSIRGLQLNCTEHYWPRMHTDAHR